MIFAWIDLYFDNCTIIIFQLEYILNIYLSALYIVL